MVRKLRIQYPSVEYDVMNRHDGREASFGVGQSRVSGPVSAVGERSGRGNRRPKAGWKRANLIR